MFGQNSIHTGPTGRPADRPTDRPNFCFLFFRIEETESEGGKAERGLKEKEKMKRDDGKTDDSRGNNQKEAKSATNFYEGNKLVI